MRNAPPVTVTPDMTLGQVIDAAGWTRMDVARGGRIVLDANGTSLGNLSADDTWRALDRAGMIANPEAVRVLQKHQIAGHAATLLIVDDPHTDPRS